MATHFIRKNKSGFYLRAGDFMAHYPTRAHRSCRTQISTDHRISEIGGCKSPTCYERLILVRLHNCSHTPYTKKNPMRQTSGGGGGDSETEKFFWLLSSGKPLGVTYQIPKGINYAQTTKSGSLRQRLSKCRNTSFRTKSFYHSKAHCARLVSKQ